MTVSMQVSNLSCEIDGMGLMLRLSPDSVSGFKVNEYSFIVKPSQLSIPNYSGDAPDSDAVSSLWGDISADFLVYCGNKFSDSLMLAPSDSLIAALLEADMIGAQAVNDVSAFLSESGSSAPMGKGTVIPPMFAGTENISIVNAPNGVYDSTIQDAFLVIANWFFANNSALWDNGGTGYIPVYFSDLTAERE